MHLAVFLCGLLFAARIQLALLLQPPKPPRFRKLSRIEPSQAAFPSKLDKPSRPPFRRPVRPASP
jgi:hypothetical protein